MEQSSSGNTYDVVGSPNTVYTYISVDKSQRSPEPPRVPPKFPLVKNSSSEIVEQRGEKSWPVSVPEEAEDTGDGMVPNPMYGE